MSSSGQASKARRGVSSCIPIAYRHHHLPSSARLGRWDTCPYVKALPLREPSYFTASYLLGRGLISETSTGSNSNFGSSASGANAALVVFNQF
jgi:hypothetical protein